MPQNEAASLDPLAGGTFSRLLFSDVEIQDPITLHHPTTATRHGFTFSADQKPPKMLCFGGGGEFCHSTSTTTDDNNNSSSPSSTTSLSSNSNMKRNMRCDNYFQPVVLPGGGGLITTTGASAGAGTSTTAPMTTTRRNYKKSRGENTPPASHAKVKKEKLGERIAALQQMVSPYGKTDTASVLHEALGYIKFLQEQVQEDGEGGGKGKKLDLGSRGLCLVPVECTLHVAESNGADLWSPAMVNPSPPLHLDLSQ
ncbi:hypothetical protein OSB04_006177 [Centaurea solstitialis]|uniref:BHLH domain-containing protein n=1 Tax=Centaurea solstitialis TaxID=347529 RepID=A0AA38WHF4_9ASTR|nr:hypothetical protein OSB04_006177 [Centaurea solstitialis]